jgi:Hint domain
VTLMNVLGYDTKTMCFMPGTRIRTPNGEIAVEKFARGDLVTTVDGRAVPIAWIGRCTVSTRFADPLRVLPIRIKAGALGTNSPARDLLLSPDHALFLDGVLVHAAALVNGSSIVRETNVPAQFTYYHIELDDHSLILAEDTPVETFIDNVDRLGFDNWQEYEALYPQGKLIAEMPYPRAKAHRQVPRAIREQLAA